MASAAGVLTGDMLKQSTTLPIKKLWPYVVEQEQGPSHLMISVLHIMALSSVHCRWYSDSIIGRQGWTFEVTFPYGLDRQAVGSCGALKIIM